LHDENLANGRQREVGTLVPPLAGEHNERDDGGQLQHAGHANHTTSQSQHVGKAFQHIEKKLLDACILGEAGILVKVAHAIHL